MKDYLLGLENCTTWQVVYWHFARPLFPLFFYTMFLNLFILCYRKFSWQHAINWNVSQKGCAGMLERELKVIISRIITWYYTITFIIIYYLLLIIIGWQLNLVFTFHSIGAWSYVNWFFTPTVCSLSQKGYIFSQTWR